MSVGTFSFRANQRFSKRKKALFCPERVTAVTRVTRRAFSYVIHHARAVTLMLGLTSAAAALIELDNYYYYGDDDEGNSEQLTGSTKSKTGINQRSSTWIPYHHSLSIMELG